MANHTSTEDSSFSQDQDVSPGAQAQAALLLVESLIHSLLDNGAMTKAQAIEAINSAYEVKDESKGDDKEPEQVRRKSLAILDSMLNSITAHRGRYDPNPDGAPPGSGIDR